MSETETVEAALLRQQDVLAKFGELALRSEDFDEILTEACRLVGDALGTDLAKVMQFQEDGITLLVRAGVGWKPGVVGEVTVRADRDSSEGYALQTGMPVVSADIDTEERFQYADFIKDNGVRALVNVAIGGGSRRPFGILQVDSRTPRDFGVAAISFLRGYANLLAAAADRFRAVAELEAAQAALSAREAAMSQSNKLEAIGQLTGGVAHDFNNLLTIIGSAAGFLARKDLPADRRKRYVEAITQTVDRASKLTGQLLAFARRQALKTEVFDVGARVEGVIELLTALLGGRITVEKELCDPACFALGDVNQFDTAVVNLAVNARDAMDGEGVLLFKVELVQAIPAVRGHVEVPGDYVAVSVSDSGTGIDAAVMDKIFEPFFSTKDQGKGTGLGLSQIIGFAKQSRGDVAVRSAPGHTTFTLYLPQSALLPDAISAAKPVAVSSAAGEGTRILVVEDNAAVGSLATEMLHDLGYQTVWAEGAASALATLGQDGVHFDLVFSDVLMPGMNGVDLAEEIRRRYPELPVVLTSGYSSVLADEGRHGFKLIHKPYSVEALSAILSSQIGATAT